jgi:probable HAF family extracellular repeat protein
MTNRPRHACTSWPFVSVLVVVPWASGVAWADSYTVTDLGVLPGGISSNGLDINEASQVSGVSDATDADGFGKRGFLFDADEMLNLGLPPLPSVLYSTAPALNDVGQLVVNGTNGAFHAFLWSDGDFVDIQQGLPNAVYSEGVALNDAGHIVGDVVLDQGGGNFPHHAFLYDGATMIDLNPLFGGNYSDAVDINDAGAIVGAARFAGSSLVRAFLVQDGVATSLSDLTSEAASINSFGDIAGGAYFDSPFERPVLFVEGDVIDLGLLPGATAGTAAAINDAGVVVGFCKITNNISHAFIYADGAMTDLNDLIPADSEWTIEEANDINLDGTIVAAARNSQGKKHAVLLTPVTECDADLDGDASVHGADLGALLSAWGECAACPADLTGDGLVDGADLGVLLAAWGACP